MLPASLDGPATLGSSTAAGLYRLLQLPMGNGPHVPLLALATAAHAFAGRLKLDLELARAYCCQDCSQDEKAHSLVCTRGYKTNPGWVLRPLSVPATTRLLRTLCVEVISCWRSFALSVRSLQGPAMDEKVEVRSGPTSNHWQSTVHVQLRSLS